MSDLRVICGDALESLRSLPEESVHCCITSPPYWGLRDYGVDGQIGLEQTPEQYAANLVEVFREVRRVLRSDGTLWLNLGDSYATGAGRVGDCPGGGKQGDAWTGPVTQPNRMPINGLKPKDLVGIPWRTAFALQADGWWLRQDIIWHKPNPMPESVTDRCTKAHEYIFLLSKSQQYYYDGASISEPAKFAGRVVDYTGDQKNNSVDPVLQATRPNGRKIQVASTRNRRSVWSVTTKPYKEAHFATFPPDLVRPMIRAGCPPAGTVLDPFAGSGTTLAVALSEARQAIGIELNPAYVQLIHQRIQGAQRPLLTV